MIPPKRKEVSSVAATQTEQTSRQTRSSTRAASSTLTAASSTSVSRSPDASISQLRSSRGEARARAASQSTASSKTSRAESTSQSPTSTESIIAGSSRSSSSVSGNSRSSSSQSPSSSVSSTVRNTQPASTSTTEPRNGHIRQSGPSVRVLHRNVPSVLSVSSEHGSSSPRNGHIRQLGPSGRVLHRNVPSVLSVSSEDGSSSPRNGHIRQLGPFVRVLHRNVPSVLSVSSEDGSSSPPSEAESENGVSSPELDESSISVSDEDRSFQSVVFDWDTTVDLTSPARPGIARAVPNFRRLSEALLQQDDLDDFSEMTLTSPPATPPLRNLMTLPENNLVDMTIDLTDSPVAAPVPSASPEQNSLGPASGSISQIKCPVCLDDLPQITSTRRNLMSTVCGHVFCSSCLPLCIRSNGRCPSCRKVLHPNQMHPIFI